MVLKPCPNPACQGGYLEGASECPNCGWRLDGPDGGVRVPVVPLPDGPSPLKVALDEPDVGVLV